MKRILFALCALIALSCPALADTRCAPRTEVITALANANGAKAIVLDAAKRKDFIDRYNAIPPVSNEAVPAEMMFVTMNGDEALFIVFTSPIKAEDLCVLNVDRKSPAYPLVMRYIGVTS